MEAEKKAKEKKEKAEKEALKKKRAEAAAAKKKKKNGSGKPVLLKIDKVDEGTRRKMLKEAQVKSDMKNATDLFSGMELNDKEKKGEEDIDDMLAADDEDEEDNGVTITEDTPLDVHPLFRAEDKSGYVKLRKALIAELKKLSQKDPLTYANSLAIDLVASMCEPLTIAQTRKVISTLNQEVKEKVKDERKARLSKTGGTSLGGAGKKKKKGKGLNMGGSFMKNDVDDMLADEGFGGDFGEDDFM